MINRQTDVGDLVYIPSEALMTDYKTFIRTEKPINVICLGRNGQEVKVFYRGASWWINKSSVYSIKEKNDS
jgi:hypothetical protein|tara:strand:- start:747 stop:959 length:213 start_codon:yes stop_codon:yes gene_type:complete